MLTIDRDPNSLLPYEDNPRLIPESAVDAVAESIRRFGFRQPIVVDEHDVVVIGHVRRQAALKLGLESVPVHVATGLSAEQARTLRLVDNRTSEMTDWDRDLLQEELEALGEGIQGLEDIFSRPEIRHTPAGKPRLAFGEIEVPWGAVEEEWMIGMAARYGTGAELQKELERRLLS